MAELEVGDLPGAAGAVQVLYADAGRGQCGAAEMEGKSGWKANPCRGGCGGEEKQPGERAERSELGRYKRSIKKAEESDCRDAR